MVRVGLIENLDQFKRDLVVVRDAEDKNRINVTLVPDLVNGLGIVATQFAFRV
jgi:phage tail sheath gpL-like